MCETLALQNIDLHFLYINFLLKFCFLFGKSKKKKNDIWIVIDNVVFYFIFCVLILFLTFKYTIHERF